MAFPNPNCEAGLKILTREEERKEDKETERLKAENLEWLYAARKLNAATTNEQERVAMGLLDSLRTGNAYINMPASVLSKFIEDKDAEDGSTARPRTRKPRDHNVPQDEEVG